MRHLIHTIAWRWYHITQGAVIAAPVYIFPAGCPRTLMGILLTLFIIVGYGNMKYLLLMLPFIYQEDINI